MARTVARRFDIVVTKDKSGSDAAQVPAAGTVDIYYVGATNRLVVFVPAETSDPFDIPVYDPGDLQVGDTFRVDDSGPSLPVLAITGGDGWLIQTERYSATDYTLPVRSRLIINSRRPVFYLDPMGVGSQGSSINTVSTTGRATGYTRLDRFDYIVRPTGLSARIYPDGQQTAVRWPVDWINAADYYSLQDAVDDVPTGGTLFIPVGDWAVPSGGLVLSRTMLVKGEPGTRLLPYEVAENEPIIRIEPSGTLLLRLRLQDLTITNGSDPEDS